MINGELAVAEHRDAGSNLDPVASWLETRGFAALLTMRVSDLIPRSALLTVRVSDLILRSKRTFGRAH
jgi:hypothetical protein